MTNIRKARHLLEEAIFLLEHPFIGEDKPLDNLVAGLHKVIDAQAMLGKKKEEPDPICVCGHHKYKDHYPNPMKKTIGCEICDCKNFTPAMPSTAVIVGIAAKGEGWWRCPNCFQELPPEDAICPHCGSSPLTNEYFDNAVWDDELRRWIDPLEEIDQSSRSPEDHEPLPPDGEDFDWSTVPLMQKVVPTENPEICHKCGNPIVDGKCVLEHELERLSEAKKEGK